MAIQLSAAARNAKLDAIELAIGTAPKVQLLTGPPPANVGLASTGTLVADISAPSDWMAGASGGTKAKLGTWSAAAIAGGTIGYYRIFDTAGTTCHLQGTVTITGGGGDLTVDNTAALSGQLVTVTTYTWTEANA